VLPDRHCSCQANKDGRRGRILRSVPPTAAARFDRVQLNAIR